MPLRLFTAPTDPDYIHQVIEDEANDVITKPPVVLFWGGWPSQWYPSPFLLDGITFNCAEQFMMFRKAMLFGDEDTAQAILECKYAKEQKELGRSAKPFIPFWDDISTNTVLQGTVAKFTQNPNLRKLLIDTGDYLIGEASPYDHRWGIGLGIKDEGAFDPSKWKGLNLLGEALMKARSILR